MFGLIIIAGLVAVTLTAIVAIYDIAEAKFNNERQEK